MWSLDQSKKDGMSMKAALYNGQDKMEVQECPDPIPDAYDVIVKVKATGICGSDLLVYNDKEEADELPAGHEVTGEIVDTGSSTDKNLLGKRVAIETIGQGRACSVCWYCRTGQYKHCQDLTENDGGGFAEYIKRKAIGCYEIADSMSWEEGALVEPLAVSIHGVKRGLMQGGESVVILGSGTIGLTTVMAARRLGAGKIFVTARHPQQAEMALALGADYAYNPDDPQFNQVILDHTEGRGADMAIETVGGNSDATLLQSIESTRAQGRIVILGGFRRRLAFDWLNPLIKEQSIIFSLCYGLTDGYHDYETAISILSDNETNLNNIVTHKYPLASIQEAFECAYDKSKGSIKVQIHQT